ncbi:MAG: serine/threonine protein kinase [Acidobacteria bacterium]|nr:serine/threonine protein kinase [Acidobacteriota bacterium]
MAEDPESQTPTWFDPSAPLTKRDRPEPGSRLTSHERFLPGAILAGRYRVVGPLGRGGMGDVYRADDLKLGQSVALKFLTARMARDREWLARFHNEVKIARQVSHPNVCRVHDIGEVDGEPFLSMEYVDGEDLASLLRRIGRLPSDKAVEIARQLAAGLAAAHHNGVLHRDLKPANVMIDGRGRVKITDFGLADLAERTDRTEVAGTAAYMAPELLSGAAPSVQSDLYALGLVLYEAFTGKPAFTTASVLDRVEEVRSRPPSPSSLVHDIDPTVERLILRCLSPDAAMRPASALAVAAALPGGDPLATALAAGVTPSPEIVAAAGGVGELSPLAAWGCFAAILATFAITAIFGDRLTLHHLVGLDKPVDVLIEQAHVTLKTLGHQVVALDAVYNFDVDADYLRYLAAQNQPLDRARDLSNIPSPLRFYYRQSPQYLVPWALDWTASMEDPPLNVSGMATLVLDPHGRLLYLAVVPPEQDVASPLTAPSDWNALLRLAGLSRDSLTPAAPAWTPPVYADSRMAWTWSTGGPTPLSLRAEAGAYRGRPVYFDIIGPWRQPSIPPTAISGSARGLTIFGIVVFVVILVGSALLARRNIRLGRGDRDGAFRLAAIVFGLSAASFVCGANHVPGANEELELFVRALAILLLATGFYWMAYIALEPIVRRRWPDLIISWTRLIGGKLTDPLVGRHILVGGVTWAITFSLRTGVNYTGGWLGLTRSPQQIRYQTLVGGRHALATLFDLARQAQNNAVMFTILLLLLALVFRRRALAAGALFLMLLIVLVLGSDTRLEQALAVLDAGVFTLLSAQLGMVAIFSFSLFFLLSAWYPLTADLSNWYAATGLMAATVGLAVATFAVYTSTGGRPFAGWKIVDD